LIISGGIGDPIIRRDPFINLTLPHLFACPKPQPGSPSTNSVVLFTFCAEIRGRCSLC
jgi:hypothetical protein